MIIKIEENHNTDNFIEVNQIGISSVDRSLNGSEKVLFQLRYKHLGDYYIVRLFDDYVSDKNNIIKKDLFFHMQDRLERDIENSKIIDIPIYIIFLKLFIGVYYSSFYEEKTFNDLLEESLASMCIVANDYI